LAKGARRLFETAVSSRSVGHAPLDVGFHWAKWREEKKAMGGSTGPMKTPPELNQDEIGNHPELDRFRQGSSGVWTCVKQNKCQNLICLVLQGNSVTRPVKRAEWLLERRVFPNFGNFPGPLDGSPDRIESNRIGPESCLPGWAKQKFRIPAIRESGKLDGDLRVFVSWVNGSITPREAG
jgi:hypothetical protein